MRMKTMIKLNQKIYPEYTLDYIKDTMSLRKPQWYSVKILNDILTLMFQTSAMKK
jgi:hypothetical protein